MTAPQMDDFDTLDPQSSTAAPDTTPPFQAARIPQWFGSATAPAKVPTPEKYHGERNIITLGNWLFTIDRYMTLTGMPPYKQVMYASTLLRGEAMLWYRSKYETTDPASLAWADVRRELREYFAPPNQDRRLNDEWAQLRQEGTVYNYVSKLQALAMQMTGLTDAIKLDKFIRGLKPKTRIEVELRDPKTTDEAYRLADRFDRIVYGYKDTFLPSTSTALNRNNSSSIWEDNRGEPMQIDSLSQRNPRAVMFNAARPAPRRSNNSAKDSDRAKGLCFNCHKPGHLARECRSTNPLANGYEMIKIPFSMRNTSRKFQQSLSGNGSTRP
jgi:Ty3 transposon capsid-like protein/Zinc knuckle